MSLPELEQINERLQRIEELLVASKSVLNIREAAILTGLSTSHLYKLTSTGGIPCYKPSGKGLYFNREELESWLLRGRKATSEEVETAACTCWVPEEYMPMRSYAYFQAYCFMKANWKPYLRQIGYEH
jgi:excisionase family DNA binding protein